MPHEHIFDYLSGRCVGPWRDLKKRYVFRLVTLSGTLTCRCSLCFCAACGSQTQPLIRALRLHHSELTCLRSPPSVVLIPTLSTHSVYGLVSAAVCMYCLYKRHYSFFYMHSSALNGRDRVNLLFISARWWFSRCIQVFIVARPADPVCSVTKDSLIAWNCLTLANLTQFSSSMLA